MELYQALSFSKVVQIQASIKNDLPHNEFWTTLLLVNKKRGLKVDPRKQKKFTKLSPTESRLKHTERHSELMN